MNGKMFCNLLHVIISPDWIITLRMADEKNEICIQIQVVAGHG